MKKKKKPKPKFAMNRLLAVAAIIVIGVLLFVIIRIGLANINNARKATQTYRDGGSPADSRRVAGGIRPESIEMTEDIFEVRERMFLAQINDIYLNAKDYLGKAIKLEGIFRSERYLGFPDTYYYVARYGPGGCCGNDGMVGFEVSWTDDQGQYPNPNAWVEAIGVLKVEEEYGYLYLDLISLAELDRRGQEYVAQ